MIAASIATTSALGLLLVPGIRKNVRQFLKWWYEIFCTCQGEAAAAAPVDGFLIIGHRGSRVHEVENTIPSFERAIQEGANGIELDLCMTKDNRIVIYHDWYPMSSIAVARALGLEEAGGFCPRFPKFGTKGVKPAHKLTLEEFREVRGYKRKKLFWGENVEAHIPTLEEFLEWASTKEKLKFVSFDMKVPKYHSKLAPKMITLTRSIIAKYNPKFQYVFNTPFWRVMKAFDRTITAENYILDNEPPFGMILNPGKFTSVTAALRWRNAFANTVHPKILTFAPWTTFRRIIQADVHYRNKHNEKRPKVPIKKVLACTLNEPVKIKCVIHLGIDGIMTDYPSLVKKIAESNGKHPA